MVGFFPFNPDSQKCWCVGGKATSIDDSYEIRSLWVDPPLEDIEINWKILSDSKISNKLYQSMTRFLIEIFRQGLKSPLPHFGRKWKSFFQILFWPDNYANWVIQELRKKKIFGRNIFCFQWNLRFAKLNPREN